VCSLRDELKSSPSSLISKFTVSTASHGSIRTRSARITTEVEGLEIIPFSTFDKHIVSGKRLTIQFPCADILCSIQNVTQESPIPYVFRFTQTPALTNRATSRMLRLELSFQLEDDGEIRASFGMTLEADAIWLQVDKDKWRTLIIPVEVPPMQVSSLRTVNQR
jgi:hypothetical protein